MYPVLTYAPSDHNCVVAGAGGLLPAVTPGGHAGHDSSGTAEHKRFPHVAFVKQDCPRDNGDPRLVAAVYNSVVHTIEYAARVQQHPRDIVGRSFGITETQNVGIEDRTRAETGTEYVAVYPDYAGNRPAVGVERARGVVRFGLETHKRVFVKLHYTAVIVKDADGIGPRLNEFVRHRRNVGSEEPVN